MASRRDELRLASFLQTIRCELRAVVTYCLLS
jgi:hypothetical protein